MDKSGYTFYKKHNSLEVDLNRMNPVESLVKGFDANHSYYGQ